MLQSLMCRVHFLVCSVDYPTPVASYYHKNYLFEGLSSWVEGITNHKDLPLKPYHSTYDPRATVLSILFFKFLLPRYSACEHPLYDTLRTPGSPTHLLGKHGLLQPLLQTQPGSQVPPCWVAQQRQRRWRPNELCGLRSAEPLQGQVEVPEGLGEAATRTHLDVEMTWGWIVVGSLKETSKMDGQNCWSSGKPTLSTQINCFLSEMSIDFPKKNKVSKVSLAQNM